tara:strand:- start:474 stop:1175 length:702 start_codon:yes stop_codon:yes gene_type:complete
MINGKKVLGITLARGGSKGIPKKNIYKINNKPLIAYTIEECLKSKYIDKYIVSTDSKEIAEIAVSYGAEVPFLRPKALAKDTSSSADAIIHAIKWLSEKNEEFEITVEAMATNPLKTATHIDECLEMMEDKQAPYVVAVNQIFDQHPSRVKYIEDGIMRDFYPEIVESRRQDLTPNAFIRSGSIYCMNTESLLKTKARYGKDNSAAYILQSGDVINIDEVNDLLMAETILKEK